MSTTQNDATTMKPISIEQLMREPTAHVDVFVQLSEKKFVLVGKAGTATAHLSRYRDKNLQYLFVRFSDLGTLLQQSLSVAGVIVGNKNIPDKAKALALETAVNSVQTMMQTCGFNDQTLYHAKVVTDATMTMCLSHNELHKLVDQLSHLQDRATQQALLCSSICSMLGIELGFTVPTTLEKLALGGFLLDIGKSKLPADIVKQPLSKLNSADTEIFKSHVELGKSMIYSLRDVPEDVALMVYEHHELADGSGYPRGIKDLLMCPLGRIASVANSFVEQVLEHPEGVKPHVIDYVIENMTGRAAHLYNRDVLKALKALGNSKIKLAAA